MSTPRPTAPVSATTLRDVLFEYTRRGWRPLLLEPGSKQTFERGWSSDPPDLDALLTRLDGRLWNVGLLLGPMSNGLVDLDLDCPEALTLADSFLPPTDAVFGRSSKPRAHRLYRCDPVPPSAAYRDVDGTMLVELRADRRLTMVPPSVHPSGEPVTWHADGAPAQVDPARLAESVRRLAAAALLARHWPTPGARQEAALALAGGLARLGWGEDAIAAFILAVAQAAQDEEADKRAAAGRDTVAKQRAGEPTTGWQRLSELVEPRVVKLVRRWLEPPVRRVGPYAFTDRGIVFVRESAHGFEERPLANFTAEIEDVLVADDGVETRRFFVLRGRVGERELPPLRVPAEKFASMTWAMEWAPLAVLHAGQATRDRVREAIQLASLDAPERRVFTHSGWRLLDGRWCFLHAGGALDANGPVEGVQVELPDELARYTVAAPPDRATLEAAVRFVWDTLPTVTPTAYAALFGALTTAPLTTLIDVDACLWCVGQTGLFKTSVVSVLLNLYGAFPPTTAPASFESTANYLEKIAFLAKDLPLLVDDVRPPQTAAEAAEWRRKIERLVRAVGNRAGRGRMAGDTSLLHGTPPRSFVVVTAEDDPAGSSTVGRTLIVRFAPGTVDTGTLAAWQRDPTPLQLAGAGYLQFLATLLDQRGPAAFRALRDQQRIPQLPAGVHPRLPQTLRHLLTGWTLFAWFATQSGAVPEEEAEQRLAAVAEQLVHHAVETAAAVRAERPSHRFVLALGDLLASRRAHLDGRAGTAPPDAEALGWVRGEDGTLYPRGERIGWADDVGLYLIPAAAHAQVRKLLHERGETFAVSSRTLLEALARDRYLLPSNRSDNRRTLVIKVEGQAVTVWPLDRAAVAAAWTGAHPDPDDPTTPPVTPVTPVTPNPDSQTDRENVPGPAARTDTLQTPSPHIWGNSGNSGNQPHRDADFAVTPNTAIGDVRVTVGVTESNPRPNDAHRLPQRLPLLPAPTPWGNRKDGAHPHADGATSEQVTPVTPVTPNTPRGGYSVSAGIPAIPFTVLTSASDGHLLDRLGKLVALDLETVGLDPYQGRIRLVAISDGTTTLLLDAAPLGAQLPQLLRRAFADRTVVLHHGAFDLGWLLVHGLPLPHQCRDTMLEALLLDAGQRLHDRRAFALATLAADHLGLVLDKTLQTSDWSGELSDAQLAYAARDAWVTVTLAEQLTPQLAERGLTAVADVENRALPFVAWLRTTGVPWDAAAWDTAVAAAEQAKIEAEAALRQLLPPDGLFGATVNLDSPKQLKQALAALGLDLPDTADETLSLADHPVAAALRRYRAAAKLVSSYGRDWATRHPVTGRVHPDWQQLGAATGRMACRDPNVQQLPREGGFRRAVAAPPGRVLVKADYSQIELRVAAELSGDPQLRAAFQRGEDVHTATARLVLGVAEPTKADRQKAKALNFGLLYGMSAEGFRRQAARDYGVLLTPEDAQRLRERFFAVYRGLRAWQRQARGDEPTDVRTRLGRLRVGVDKLTTKLNTPVQGTAADGLKCALALLWEQRQRLGSAVPVVVCHDEIVFECDTAEAEHVAAVLERLMVRGMQRVLRKIPVAVEVAVCRDWSGTPLVGGDAR
ncbi:DNA polymerase I [bacterium HR27]|nr:DNA polymerase I [bacterium HR27]